MSRRPRRRRWDLLMLALVAGLPFIIVGSVVFWPGDEAPRAFLISWAQEQTQPRPRAAHVDPRPGLVGDALGPALSSLPPRAGERAADLAARWPSVAALVLASRAADGRLSEQGMLQPWLAEQGPALDSIVLDVVVKTTALLDDGRVDEAVAWCLDAFALGRDLSLAPDRFASGRRFQQRILTGCWRTFANAPDPRRTLLDVHTIEAGSGLLVNAARHRVWQMNARVAAVLAPDALVALPPAISSQISPPPPSTSAVPNVLMRPLWGTAHELGLRIAATFELPEPRGTATRATVMAEAADGGIRSHLAAQLLPDFQDDLRLDLAAEAQFAVATCALALRVHRQELGSFPASLADVSSDACRRSGARPPFFYSVHDDVALVTAPWEADDPTADEWSAAAVGFDQDRDE